MKVLRDSDSGRQLVLIKRLHRVLQDFHMIPNLFFLCVNFLLCTTTQQLEREETGMLACKNNNNNNKGNCV